MKRPWTNTLWLIRREFWENRSIWIVPLVIGALLILGALFGRVDISLPVRAGPSAGGTLLFAFGSAFVLLMSIYSTWYLLDCLYADRKDRSLLFWKSLPVSDAEMVLSKLATALLVIPAVYFVIADLTTLVIAFVVSVRARGVFSLWHADPWLQLQAMWIYLIVTLAIWYLPVAAWTMLISAWARSAVLLWSILPPLGLYLAERWFAGSNLFGELIGDRLLGYVPAAFNGQPAGISLPGSGSLWDLMNPAGFLSRASTWGGAAFGVALLYAVIELRRRRMDT